MVVNHFYIRRQAASNTNHRNRVAFRHPGHADGHFAMDRLAVDSPFPGDHQVRITHGSVKCQRFGNNFNALAQIRAAERIQRHAHAARRAAAF